MKKNIVKTMLKAAATTAMVAAMFVGGNKMEAKAITIEQFAEIVNTPVAEVKADPMWMECYYSGYHDDSLGTYEEMKAWVGSVESGTATATVTSPYETVATVAGETVLRPEMLGLLNAERAIYGAAPLVWNEEMANHCIDRVPVVLGNFQSAEYKEARKNGEPSGVIAHKGSVYKENARWNWNADTAAFANEHWNSSEGHHDVRVRDTYTQYACASYLDPVTGQECWIEVFE